MIWQASPGYDGKLDRALLEASAWARLLYSHLHQLKLDTQCQLKLGAFFFNISTTVCSSFPPVLCTIIVNFLFHLLSLIKYTPTFFIVKCIFPQSNSIYISPSLSHDLPFPIHTEFGNQASCLQVSPHITWSRL